MSLSIRADRFDEMVFDRAEEEIPSIQKRMTKTADKLKDILTPEQQETLGLVARELVNDAFQIHHQAIPEIDPEAQAFGHIGKVFEEVMHTQEYHDLHALSAGNLVNSAIATQILDEKLLDRIKPETLAQGMLEQDREALELAKNDESTDEQTQQELGGQIAQIDQQIEQLAQAGSEKLDGDKLRRAYREIADEISGQLELVQALYGTAPGTPEMRSAQEKLQFAQKIANSSRWKQLFKVMGRFQHFALASSQRKVEDVPHEIVGIELGSDLERMLPSEFMYLTDPDLEDVFLKNFVEGNLMQWEMQGEDNVGKGPIVLLIDGSGSMAGGYGRRGALTPEIWSKAAMLGFLALAEREKRDVYVRQFGSTHEHRDWVFPYQTHRDAVRPEALFEAGEYFLNGGTDFMSPLTWALGKVTAGDEWSRSDVVIITDGQAPVSPQFREKYTREKEEKNFRAFGLFIGTPGGGSSLAPLLDRAIDVDVRDDRGVLEAVFA